MLQSVVYIQASLNVATIHSQSCFFNDETIPLEYKTSEKTPSMPYFKTNPTLHTPHLNSGHLLSLSDPRSSNTISLALILLPLPVLAAQSTYSMSFGTPPNPS